MPWANVQCPVYTGMTNRIKHIKISIRHCCNPILCFFFYPVIFTDIYINILLKKGEWYHDRKKTS
jgi:hypothetical protein